MAYEVVSAYTLLVGEADGPSVVSVHTTAEDAWAALVRSVRGRSRTWVLPRRRWDEESATRVANAWRAGDPQRRYWNVTAHRLPIPMPEIARGTADALDR